MITSERQAELDLIAAEINELGARLGREYPEILAAIEGDESPDSIAHNPRYDPAGLAMVDRIGRLLSRGKAIFEE